jgi:hypothetical protein
MGELGWEGLASYAFQESLDLAGGSSGFLDIVYPGRGVQVIVIWTSEITPGDVTMRSGVSAYYIALLNVLTDPVATLGKMFASDNSKTTRVSWENNTSQKRRTYYS